MATRRPILQLSRRAALGALPRTGSGTLPRSISHETKTSLRRNTHIEPAVCTRRAQKRWHTAPAGLKAGKKYDFADIKRLVESPSQDVILIDVREPAEYQAGFIPTALNIPITSQPDAFHLPADDFLDRFGFAKPSTKAEVVVYCKAGVRSRAAAQLAMQNGYERVGEYPGSWVDWERNGGESSKDPQGGGKTV